MPDGAGSNRSVLAQGRFGTNSRSDPERQRWMVDGVPFLEFLCSRDSAARAAPQPGGLGQEVRVAELAVGRLARQAVSEPHAARVEIHQDLGVSTTPTDGKD